jgi:uncharacterized protein
VVCSDCVVADRMLARMRGLLGRRSMDRDEGLLITRTSSIHTFFMAFPIDAVFLDRDLRVHSIVPDIKPSRMVWRRGSRHVIELAAGEAGRVGLEQGRQLSWQGV